MQSPVLSKVPVGQEVAQAFPEASKEPEQDRHCDVLLQVSHELSILLHAIILKIKSSTFYLTETNSRNGHII